MDPELPPPRAEQGLEWLVIAIIVGAGILLGLLAQGWLQVALWSLVVGVTLNLALLCKAVVQSGNLDRFGVAIFGSIPAGIYDGVKIFIIGIALYGLRSWLS